MQSECSHNDMLKKMKDCLSRMTYTNYWGKLQGITSIKPRLDCKSRVVSCPNGSPVYFFNRGLCFSVAFKR